MTDPRPPQPGRPAGTPRARGTTRLDGYAFSAATPRVAPEAVSKEALAEVIAEAEGMLKVLRPRFGALARALQALAQDEAALDALFAGVSPEERGFTTRLVAELEAHPEGQRKARIAYQQYQQAEAELAIAKNPESLEGLSASKFRGTLYPLYHVGVAFIGMPLMAQLFPKPRAQETQPLNAPPAAPPRATEADPGSRPRPLSDQAADLSKRATGWLRNVYDSFTNR